MLWQLLRWMREKRRHLNIFQILRRTGMVNNIAMIDSNREKADLSLEPPLPQIDVLNWSGFERAIAAGYECAARRLERLPLKSMLVNSANSPGWAASPP